MTAPASGDTDITIYSWDNRNRLASVTHYSSLYVWDWDVTYLYDAFNRWVGQLARSSAKVAVGETRFVYDGNNIVLKFEVYTPQPLGGEGLPAVTASDLTDRFLWAPGTDQLLADEQLKVDTGDYEELVTDTVLWALTDNVNTVRDLAVFDAAADAGAGATTVVDHRMYTAYGVMLSQTNPSTLAVAGVDCIFGFTGQAMCVFSIDSSTGAATGLQNNLNRWYDAASGQWLSQDPSGLRADVNPYRYCGDSPTNYVDPTGRDRYIVTNGFHWWLVVEQWGVNANGAQVVVGYTALDYSALGFTMRPADTGSTIDPTIIPSCSKSGPGAYGSWVMYQYLSNSAQDNELLRQWMMMGGYTWNPGWALGYGLAAS